MLCLSINITVHVLIFRWLFNYCKSTAAPLVLGCTINQNKKNHHEYLHELIKFKDPIECQWSDPADKLTTPVL